METVVESRTRKVVIGPDRPFTIIGERINPTGRKVLAAELLLGDFTRVIADAEGQVESGASMLDVNAGLPGTDEADLLARLVEQVQEVTDVPLSIDSSIATALAAGLEAAHGKPLVNSVTGEEEKLEAILPLVARRRAAVIGLTLDEAGPSSDPAERLRIARRIVARAADHGIPAEDLVLDPLAMTVGAEPQAALVTLETLRLIREELGANTTLGASNISFGLPRRRALNASFLALAAGSGLTSAIANPLDTEAMRAVRACDALLARDPYGMEWIRAHRAGR